METIALILAAGRENAMNSQRAKELHELMGRTVLEETVAGVRAVTEKSIAILGHHAEELRPALPKGCDSCVQDFARGIGSAKAVEAAMTLIPGNSRLLITAGDMPCVRKSSYLKLVSAVDGEKTRAAVLYADVKHPGGMDRVRFDGDGDVRGIAHAGSLLPHEEDIPSVNMRVYCIMADTLRPLLHGMKPDAAGTCHLSDLLTKLSGEGTRIAAVEAEDPREGRAVNDRQDLAAAIAFLRERHCLKHMRRGVTIIDPEDTYIESDVEIGVDTVIWPGCYIRRGTRIGRDCVLYPGCRLTDVRMGDGATVDASILSGCDVAPGERVGPFANKAGERAKLR